jgi:hypothetical protein
MSVSISGISIFAWTSDHFISASQSEQGSTNAYIAPHIVPLPEMQSAAQNA